MQSAAASVDVAMISGELARSGHLKNCANGNVGSGRGKSFSAGEKNGLGATLTAPVNIPSSKSR
eukprot:scaffold116299_cov90-Phaeocystis_antarctica.AAC.1